MYKIHSNTGDSGCDGSAITFGQFNPRAEERVMEIPGYRHGIPVGYGTP